jgi:T5SS/PEP-CTERM-associated repeat protein
MERWHHRLVHRWQLDARWSPTAADNASINISSPAVVPSAGAVANQVSVGRTTGASLGISAGGTLTSGNVDIGLTATGTGVVTVSGAGASWTFGSCNCRRGRQRYDQRQQRRNGDRTGLTLIGQTGGAGTISISGTGSTWIGGVLSTGWIVGANGTGTANITNGGRRSIG